MLASSSHTVVHPSLETLGVHFHEVLYWKFFWRCNVLLIKNWITWYNWPQACLTSRWPVFIHSFVLLCFNLFNRSFFLVALMVLYSCAILFHRSFFFFFVSLSVFSVFPICFNLPSLCFFLKLLFFLWWLYWILLFFTSKIVHQSFPFFWSHILCTWKQLHYVMLLKVLLYGGECFTGN